MFFRSLPLLLILAFCSPCQADDGTKNPLPLPVPKKVVVIGDSLSTGFGVATPWTAHFSEVLGVELVNAAVKNQETSFGLNLIDEVLTREKPSHVIILMGTNDAVRGSVTNALVNLQKMVDIARSHDATVVLGTLPPIHGNSFRNHQAEMISDRVPYIKGCITANVRAKFADDRSLFVDDVHPSDAGQLKIADAFLELFDASHTDHSD